MKTETLLAIAYNRWRAAGLLQHELAEPLGVGDRRVLLLAPLRAPLPHHLVRIPIAHLALVRAESLDLLVQVVGNIDREVGVLPTRHIDLVNAVRLQTLVEQFREDAVVSRR